MANKISIRFYNDREVRAIWDKTSNKWWFSATDIVRAINDEEDYKKAGNYWRWLKKKLVADGIQLVSVTHEFKFMAPDMAHPFMEGNGRSTRIWLDLILKKRLKKCVDWSQISKNDYLKAMELSAVDSTSIKYLLQQALTDKIDDREIFMKGIDYSYYYEEN